MKTKNYIFFTILLLLCFNFKSNGQNINNTFNGLTSGSNNSGNYNNGFGFNSLMFNSGNSNSAFGINTLINSRGGFNNAFGNDALRRNSTGELNCAFGTRALENNLSGSNNIAIGHRAMGDSQNPGSFNTALGYASLLRNKGNGNIAIGYFTPRNLLNGNNNIFMGNENGGNLINGSDNILLGRVILSNSQSTSIVAGNNTDRTIILADGNGSQRMLISSRGNVGLGLGNNVIPANKLDVGGGVVIGRNFTPKAIPFQVAGSIAPTNGLLVEGRVGIGTNSPANKVEITHGVTGNSGLRFTNLNSNFVPNTVNSSNSFLSVNLNGDVVLQRLPNYLNTNLLSSNGNTLTSNVNALVATAPIVNSIANAINNNNQLITTVNGVSSQPVTIPIPTFTELDGSITNELQTISQSGNTITLSNGGGSFTLPTFVDNDSQTLSLVGNNLTISNGNTVVLPTYTDAQSLTVAGNTLTISNGNSITLPTTTIVAGNNVTVTGTGLPSNPFQINSIDTSLYANNGIINQATTIDNNRVVDLNDRNIWFNSATSPNHGKIYIGSTWDYPNNTGNYKLFVEGGILTEKVKVALRNTNNWADYVFANDYKLMPLKHVEEFINKNNHLPGIDSAEDLVKNGLDLASMQAKQMEKIEELTLYIIEQNKTLERQNKEIEELKNQMKSLIQKK